MLYTEVTRKIKCGVGRRTGNPSELTRVSMLDPDARRFTVRTNAVSEAARVIRRAPVGETTWRLSS